MKIKRILKRAGTGLGVVVAAVAAYALYIDIDGIPRYAKPDPTDKHVVELTPARVQQGAKLSALLCAGCHENTETHKLTGKAMTDLPPEFGPIVSKNITKHPVKGIGTWTDGELRHFFRTGIKRDGQYAMPFMIKMPHMADEDIDSIIAFLRSDDPLVAPSDVDPPGETKPTFLAKALTHTVFGPLDYPKQPIVKPSKNDAVAYGRYLTVTLDCHGCHSADFTKINIMEPEKSKGYMGGGNLMKEANGKEIRTANLTPDEETGIGKWTEAQFVRAVKQGFRPDGRMLHYPMEMRPQLEDEEVAAIYAYLRTIPKIRNAVPRPAMDAPTLSQGDLKGKQLYASYGCASCHGETGKGQIGDLRKANETYPTDVELRKWIDDAPSMKPGTKMPGWKGMIKEEDYPPLMSYVRVLSSQAASKSAMND